jgi:hypothetical protein
MDCTWSWWATSRTAVPFTRWHVCLRSMNTHFYFVAPDILRLPDEFKAEMRAKQDAL